MTRLRHTCHLNPHHCTACDRLVDEAEANADEERQLVEEADEFMELLPEEWGADA